MERRRAVRRSVAGDEPLSGARLRTGAQLRIVDASSWGALAETTERLLPGRHLDLHVVSAQGRVLVRARVVRAYVSELEAHAVHYRTALAFDQALNVRVEGYAIPAALPVVEIDQGKRYPTQALPGDIEFVEQPSA
jgi:hypothetical protein